MQLSQHSIELGPLELTLVPAILHELVDSMSEEQHLCKAVISTVPLRSQLVLPAKTWAGSCACGSRPSRHAPSSLADSKVG